jgi:two-component system, OmpR family, sensor histidine kinase ArlS
MKLLTRTVRNYVIFSVLLLLVSTPLFYFSIQQLFVHKMDEELLSHKSEFYGVITLLKTEEDITLFGLMNDEFMLTESNQLIRTDSLLTVEMYDEIEKELNPYRVLRTGVTIQDKHYVLQIRESIVSTTDLVSAIMTIHS